MTQILACTFRAVDVEARIFACMQALAVDDMSNIKEMVDDYMERNQEDFEDFLSPDDVYEEILHHLDSLEVC